MARTREQPANHVRADAGTAGLTAITADEPAVNSGALRDALESNAFIHSAQTEEINR